jgi:hypothetical protein
MHFFSFRSILACAAFLSAGSVAAQDTTSVKSDRNKWSFSAQTDAYVIPGDPDYLQPTAAADYGRLHLEVRYNYETVGSGSLWLGYNVNTGKKLTVAFTPMLSLVIGETNGVAPGYELLLNWRRLELYSEGEWVFSVKDFSDSFYFAWSEITLSPVDWLSFGIVGQRTQAFDGVRDIQRGVLLRVVRKQLELTAHAFNPETSNPLYVFTVGVEF